MLPAQSRRELGHTVCEHLGWFTPKGDYRIQPCLRMLEQLEHLGILSLPAKRESMQRGPLKPAVRTRRPEPGPAIEGELKPLMPLSVDLATGREAVADWNETVELHHYLGYRRPFGPHLRYVIRDRQGRKLGCLLFEAAAAAVPCRNDWIGWQDRPWKAHLNLVVRNSRFLILPWVRVKCLASKALSMAVRRLAGDWQAHHGLRPVLVETFVDPGRFDATCYRAANWRNIGLTKGRKGSARAGGKTSKAVYVYPLARNFKSILLNGRPAVRRRRTPPRFTPGDPFVRLWRSIIGTAVAVAHDRLWQRRRRVLNTLLIMLFVFRLVFSKDRQGYAITLAELWDQCRALGVALPQAQPVAASAVCNARAKLDENVFKILHGRILEQAGLADAGKRWKGHRIFAVDGTKINLPRPLIEEGYRTPSRVAHYPQGLVSCLYQLQSKIPVDFDLHAHENEREAALAHLKALSENDVVIYDRGYYSWELLRAHAERGLHPVFRIKRNSAFDAFIAGRETEAIIGVAPGENTLRRLRLKHRCDAAAPCRLRLVKYTAGETLFVLGTTLLDCKTYPAQDLRDLYLGRWGIEELYKISKQLMTVQDFHGQSGRGVKQELYAHFILITLTRLFSNRGEDRIKASRPGDTKPAMQANFKNSLATVARNIEGLLLQQAAMLSETLTRIVATIAACRQRVRPNRSYPRRSRKPVGKWQPARTRGGPITSKRAKTGRHGIP